MMSAIQTTFSVKHEKVWQCRAFFVSAQHCLLQTFLGITIFYGISFGLNLNCTPLSLGAIAIVFFSGRGELLVFGLRQKRPNNNSHKHTLQKQHISY